MTEYTTVLRIETDKKFKVGKYYLAYYGGIENEKTMKLTCKSKTTNGYFFELHQSWASAEKFFNGTGLNAVLFGDGFSINTKDLVAKELSLSKK